MPDRPTSAERTIRDFSGNELLDAMLDVSPNAAVVTDAAGTIVRVNRRFCDMWGLVPGASVGRTLSATFAEVADTLVDPDAFRSTDIDAGVFTDTDIERSNGEIINVVHSALPGADGTTVAWAWFFRDVTRYRESERERMALAKADAAMRVQMAFMTEAATRLAMTLDVDATVATVLDLAVPALADWCVIFARDGERDLVHLGAAHIDAERTALLAQIERERPMSVDDPYGVGLAVRTGDVQYASGLTREMLVAGVGNERIGALLDACGTHAVCIVPLNVRGRAIGAAMFVVGGDRDSFARHEISTMQQFADRVAIALDNADMFREAQARSHAANVLAHIADGVMLVDDEGVVRFINEAARTIVGAVDVEVVGVPVVEAIAGWSHIAWRIPVAERSDPTQRAYETLPLVDMVGVTWLEASGVRVPGGTVYAFRDVTREREIEQVRSDFVATVSHELRTPLASVYGAALTLQRTDVTLDPSTRDELVAVIASESHRLSSIVADILAASSLDNGTVQLDEQSFDLARLISEVIESARHQAPESITLAMAVGFEGSDLVMVGDEGRVRQVIVNLVDNAIKYSPGGGVVEIGIEHAADDHAHIWVRDPGIGIPTRDLSRVFEKFHRLDAQHARGVSGTGLGLYISRELVARMGGTMSVESTPDEGSTFHVMLPLSGAAARRPIDEETPG